MTIVSDVEYAITAASPGTMGAGVAGYGGPVVPPPLVQSTVNLVRSSRTPSDGNARWQNGFSYLPMSNGELDLFSDCGPEGEQIPVTKNGVATMWQPYVLSARFRCSLMGYNVADYQARAAGLLEAATPKMLEYEFWHGTLNQAAGWENLYLDSGPTDVYSAVSILDAVGTCEYYLGLIGYGGRGMIHMSSYLAPYLQLASRREGNLLLTNRDTIVVPGGGYGAYPAAIAPQDSSPGQAKQQASSPEQYAAPPKPTGPFKIFATGITDVRLGEIVPVPDNDSFYQAVDRSTNSVMVGAQRYGCVSWDGVAFAQVNLTLTP